EKWRTSCLLEQNKLQVLADLGHNVLDDALVEAAAYVSRHSSTSVWQDTYWAATLLDVENKELGLAQAITSETSRAKHGRLRAFTKIPGSSIAYWFPESLLSSLFAYPKMIVHVAEARVGLQTDDDFRFLRLAWEFDLESFQEKWRYIAKGGEYSPFYDDLHLV